MMINIVRMHAVHLIKVKWWNQDNQLLHRGSLLEVAHMVSRHQAPAWRALRTVLKLEEEDCVLTATHKWTQVENVEDATNETPPENKARKALA